MRTPNIDLIGYADIMNPKIKVRVGNKKQTMADMPYYDKNNEPEKLHEEVLIETRYKSLIESYARSYDVPVNSMAINPLFVQLNIMENGAEMFKQEKGHYRELERVAENIIRQEYNLAEDEILFDLEITGFGNVELPEECNKAKKIEWDFTQSTDPDILKKRTLNALCQGAALKSHYIFHLYREEITQICPYIIEYYQKSLVGNDVYYFMLDDDDFSECLSRENPPNAGYVKLRFDGDVPVLEAKAITMPILIHEITKGLIMFLTTPGMQNMDESVLDETDFIMSELWEIRFGATLWEKFYGLLNIDDYDIKKLIFLELFKKDSEEFLEFMDLALNNPEAAKTEVNRIARTIRNSIYNATYEDED